MSWSIFKQEMKAKMVNSSFKSTNEFADFFTQKYDQCMKRGLDVTTQNTVIKGNTELMRATILYALEAGLTAKTPVFYNQSIALLGKGAVAYWTGAELGKIPPLIPAPGTILNLSVVTNTTTNPGTWPPTPFPVFPSTSNDPYLDAFILQATIHLQTVSGFCNTISQYPPTAPPGPAVLPWVGFNVEVSPASQPNTKNAEEILQPKPELSDKDFIMSDIDTEVSLARQREAEEQLELIKQEERDVRDARIVDTYEELIIHEKGKLDTKRHVSLDADESSVDDDIELNDYINRILDAARADLNVREQGGNNRGARIEEMLIAVGFPPPKIKGKEGEPWCAAALSDWWRKAGILTPNIRAPFDGDASCVNWKKWGEKNGLFTKNPTVGGAIIYKSYDTDLKRYRESHIGVVESYNPKTGEIVTIEGNTVPQEKGYSRDGGGVYRKKTSLKQLLKDNKLSGFVIPVERARNPIRD
jgi:hypothetical protein